MKPQPLVSSLAVLGVWLGLSVSGSAQSSPALVSKDQIIETLDQEILVPKGTTAKSAKIMAREVRRINIEAIEFQFDSTELANDHAREQVRLLAQALTDPRLASGVFSLVGHASADGNPDHNLDLSQRRAEAIRTILIRDYGIPQTRLAAWGKGANELLPGLAPDSPKHRRVVVIREE
jgi:outer membrane protein OmpA-like peptidoglycan-associated protein